MTDDNQLLYKNVKLSAEDLGDKVPRRGMPKAVKFGRQFTKLSGWRTVGEIPNISQAIMLAVPHTSNADATQAFASILSLDVNINMIGKKDLFSNPIMSKIMSWMGVLPIDRDNKGSVLQSSIDMFADGKPLFLGIAPEGTRAYREEWKSGFYYIALGANIPIIPVAMDYGNKEVRFMNVFYPTGDYEADLEKILAYYKGVVPKNYEGLSQPLRDLKDN